MSQRPISTPVRIALAGLGLRGRFHQQRLSLRDDCLITAGWDPDPIRRSSWSNDGWQASPTLCALLAHPSWDALLISETGSVRQEIARAALEAGRTIILEAPGAATLEELTALFTMAARSGGRLLFLHHCHGDGEFRTAQEILRIGRLGPLQAARFSARNYAPAGAETEELLFELTADCLDQLLHWTAAEVVRIGCPVWSAGPVNGLLLHLEFADGLFAQIDISQEAFAPLNTGWMLDGVQGGYALGRWYRATAEGELIDAPCERLPTDLDLPYREMLTELWEPQRPAHDTSPARVLAILDAAHSSHRERVG